MSDGLSGVTDSPFTHEYVLERRESTYRVSNPINAGRMISLRQATTPTMPMQLPPRIPGYELMQLLGGGPMTCVFSAHELHSDTSCAVKLLRPDCKDRETAVKLLQREARAGLSVQHAHLVRFRNTHVTKRPYFLVMELLAGESLRRRLRRDYKLNVPAALWIARQTAEGLQALHRAGFIHGDVKPDNIRLIDDGTAVLIDLGFAHRPGENARFQGQGLIVGTANYMAPEHCGGQGEDGPASDIFSLGVTLFEMLAGGLPYPPGSVEQVLRRHASDPPFDVRAFAGAIPETLAVLVDRMLKRNPAERPRASTIVQQLIALEIATLAPRKIA